MRTRIRAVHAVVVAALATSLMMAGTSCGGRETTASAVVAPEAGVDGTASPAPLLDSGAPPLESGPGGPGPADGVCTPGSVALGLFDPDCVYLLGTTRPGSAGYDVILDPRSPSQVAAGVGSAHFYPNVQSSTGKLLFVARLHDAYQAFVFTPGKEGEGDTAQLSRDPQIATPGCSSDPSSLRRIFALPDDDTTLYECIYRGDNYYLGGGSAPFDIQGKTPLAFGAGRTFLGTDLSEAFYIVSATDTKQVRREGDAGDDGGAGAFNVVAVRSRLGGGFMLAVAEPTPYAYALYDVAPDGLAVRRGAYHMGSINGGKCVLDPTGALYCVSTIAPPITEGVVKLTFGAPPEVVFDDRNQTVKIGGGHELITGP